MRVRKRKGAEEHLANHPQYVILEPEAAKGKWHELFGNDNPIHIEVGSGKGAFITGMAQQNPDINYIGIDIQLSVLSMPWIRFWLRVLKMSNSCAWMVQP